MINFIIDFLFLANRGGQPSGNEQLSIMNPNALGFTDFAST